MAKNRQFFFVKNSSAGFTILEMVVVMIILVLVGGAFAINLLRSSERASLSMAVIQLKSDIRQTRIDAMTNQRMGKIEFVPSQNQYHIYFQKEDADEWLLERESSPFKDGITIASSTLAHGQIVFDRNGVPYENGATDMPSQSTGNAIAVTRNVVVTSGSKDLTLSIAPETAFVQ